MTAKKYRKTATIEAEQFNEAKWQEKYRACHNPDQWEALAHPYGIDRYHGHFIVVTLEGDLILHDGDWIATGINGDHWPIADDIFRKTYVEAEK